jgi:drug/metabolite transporter (DMT)-like permease
LALLVMLPPARGAWSWSTALVGAAYAVTAILFVSANKLTTAAHTIFLQGTSPLYILLLGPLLLHERVRRRDVVTLVVMAGGMALFFLGAPAPARTAPNPRAGNLLAALTGLTSALMLMGLRWLGRAPSPACFDGAFPAGGQGGAAPAVVLGNLLAFAVCLPFALPVAGARPSDWAILVFLGFFQIALAYTLLVSALRHLPALEASLLMFIEPVLSVAWAWLAHGERPGAWAFGGAALILAGTLLSTTRPAAD